MGREPTEGARASAANTKTGTAARLPEELASGGAPDAEAPDTAADTPEIRRGRAEAMDELAFNLAVDVIYHRGRQAWLLRLHRLATLLAIVAGSSAAIEVVNAKAAAFVAAAAAAADMTFDLSMRAAAHGDVVRELLAAVADLHDHDTDPDAYRRAVRVYITIGAGGDPAPYHVARALAFNEAAIALGRADRRAIPWWRRSLAHCYRFEGY